MADAQKPEKLQPAVDKPSNDPPRPREKYPTIPLPQRRTARRPEIALDPTDRGRWPRRLAVALLWFLVLIMAAGAALRIFLHDWWIPLVWWNAFTLYVYLPAYVCLAIAVVIRRWRIALVAGVVSICHLAWIAPDFVPHRSPTSSAAADLVEAASPADGRLRLYYQNVHIHADDFQSRIEEMLAANADVIALVEFNPDWEAAVRESRISELYPHNTLRENPRSQQMVVFSKLPLDDVKYQSVAGHRLAVAATLRAGDRPFRLFCIHAPRPVLGQAEEYYSFARDLIEWVDQSEGPRIVVGDFNSTQHAAWYKRLLSVADLHSAHRAAGRGYAVTWPNGRFLVPPIRIDHVLLSEEFTCLSIREGNGGQSDHKPLICDLRLAAPDPPERKTAKQINHRRTLPKKS